MMRIAFLVIAVFVVLVLMYSFVHFGWIGLIDAALGIAFLGAAVALSWLLARILG